MGKKDYVGVDEKYAPKDEEETKEEDIGDKVNKDLNSAYDRARDYVSDKDNQEKIKNVGKKSLKIAKGVGIGYIILIGLILVMGVMIFIVGISKIFTSERAMNDSKKNAEEIKENIEKTKETIEKEEEKIKEEKLKEEEINKTIEINSFNDDLELFAGTNSGAKVLTLIDKVVLKVKKNKDHIITVIYDGSSTSNTEDMIRLKNKFENTIDYEVTFDYDNDGFINKLTIFDK